MFIPDAMVTQALVLQHEAAGSFLISSLLLESLVGQKPEQRTDTEIDREFVSN